MSKINKKEAGIIAKTFPVQPLFGKVIITLNNLESDGGLVLSDNILSDRQYVISKGDNVTAVSVGQEVLIDIDKLMVAVKTETVDAYQTQMQVKIDPIEVDGVTYAIIEDRFIKAKYLK